MLRRCRGLKCIKLACTVCNMLKNKKKDGIIIQLRKSVKQQLWPEKENTVISCFHSASPIVVEQNML